MNKNTLIGGILVAGLVMAIGFGVYLYQQGKTLTDEKTELSERVTSLTDLAETMERKVNEYLAVQGRPCAGLPLECLDKAIGATKQNCPGVVINGACILNNFILVSPNGGERLCQMKEYEIKWKNPDDMKFVNVYVREGNNAARKIGTYPANFNEIGEKGYGSVLWKVNMQEGYVYELIVNSDYNGRLVSDTSDSPFSIINCQG